MILLGQLYTLCQQTETPQGPVCTLKLNPDHFIYQAHFPGHPITPGVCLVQMVLELLEKSTGYKLSLRTVKNVKFLHVVTPAETPEICCRLGKVEVDTAAGRVSTQAVLYTDKETLAKVSLVCNLL